jgi:hypothetical protein
MKESLETPDLFKSASLLCGGASLVKTRSEGRSMFFILQGQDLKQKELCYKTGALRVNPLEFKVYLNRLRDLINCPRPRCH